MDKIELGKGNYFKCGKIIELKRSVIKENDNYQNVYTLTIEDINADQISYEYSSHESKIGNELVGSILYFIVKDNKIAKLTSSDAEQLLDEELTCSQLISTPRC